MRRDELGELTLTEIMPRRWASARAAVPISSSLLPPPLPLLSSLLLTKQQNTRPPRRLLLVAVTVTLMMCVPTTPGVQGQTLTSLQSSFSDNLIS
ncbi:hypothetical protein ElyMa_000606500, partial [Elysia marginata]